jgi:hypothetical protein
VTEPVNPFQRGILNVITNPPGAALVDDFSFVQPVDCLGQGIVEGVLCRVDYASTLTGD